MLVRYSTTTGKTNSNRRSGPVTAFNTRKAQTQQHLTGHHMKLGLGVRGQVATLGDAILIVDQSVNIGSTHDREVMVEGQLEGFLTDGEVADHLDAVQ